MPSYFDLAFIFKGLAMNKTEWKSYQEITSIKVGDKIVSGSGVEFEVLAIEIQCLNLRAPSILVTYDYNDNGFKGNETVGITNFYSNICS